MTPRHARLLGLLIMALALPARAEPCRAPMPLEQHDALLQSALESRLRRAGMGPALDQGRLGVALVDLSHDGQRWYAGLNDDVMMYAASLPKIAILLAVVDGVEHGRIQWTDEFSWKLRRMITISNNAYATWGAELVGLPGIGRVMRDPRYCFYEPGVGGLWVGRPFAKGGESYREPLKSLSHAASARQTARFYAMLDAGQLVSHTWSARMRDLMGPPEYFHKFVKAIGDREGLRFVARKSGTWKQFHADSALIEHGSNRYVLVGLAEQVGGGKMMQTLAAVADDLIMDGAHRRRRFR